MEQTSSKDPVTLQHQYDYVCKLAMKYEKIDYQRECARFYKKELRFADLAAQEMLYRMDEYDVEKCWFQVMGYHIGVKDMLLAEALQSLPERKRDIILLYYYKDMTDAEIGRAMRLVSSTIQEHRQRSLKMLRQKMKGSTDEKRQKMRKKKR